MAIMINCAIDWSLDLAWADAESVTALPFKRGLYRKNKTEGQDLFQYLKTSAKYYKEEVFGGRDIDTDYFFGGYVYVGDAWLAQLDWDYISDWYKDAYGQRPHFLKEFFAIMCGLPCSGETGMFFCNPVENYLRRAKWNREHI